jgi:hypothetical protein
MAILASPAIQSQLLTVKHLHWIVRDLYAPKADEASRIIAVVLLDYVVESTLKTLLWNLPSEKAKPKRDPNFPDLWDAVDDLSQDGPLPLKAEIMSLHELRRLTQHRNAVPSPEDVHDHTTHVASFLRNVFSKFFNLDLDGLTLASLVLDPGLRGQLESAEAHLVAGRQREAVEEAAKALYKAVRIAGDVAGVARNAAWNVFRISASRGWNQFSREQQRVLETIASWIDSLTGQLQETLRALAVGTDWASYMRYRAIAPRVFSTFGPTPDGTLNVVHNKDDYSEEEARAVFDYAVNHVLRLEAMGALPGPAQEE